MAQVVQGCARRIQTSFGTNMRRPRFSPEYRFHHPVDPNRSSPNKAPEPTTFAVTSRAIVRLIEMKQRNPNRDAARAAPAKVVAHL